MKILLIVAFTLAVLALPLLFILPGHHHTPSNTLRPGQTISDACYAAMRQGQPCNTP